MRIYIIGNDGVTLCSEAGAVRDVVGIDGGVVSVW